MHARGYLSKRQVEEESSAEEEVDSVSEEDSKKEPGTDKVDIDVEFELKDPSPMFTDSVLMMMNHFGQGVFKDIFNMTQKILSDEWLTSCVTMVGDEVEGTNENSAVTCYGFATIVNLAKYRVGSTQQDEKFTKEILAFLKEKYGKEHHKTYEDIVATKQKGLFMREKYYNLPDEVADTLLRQVREDYRFIEENEEDEEEDQYRFEKVLYIMRYSPVTQLQKAPAERKRALQEAQRRQALGPRWRLVLLLRRVRDGAGAGSPG